MNQQLRSRAMVSLTGPESSGAGSTDWVDQ